MDKTVESFKVDLEGEICRWSGFARALRKEDREAFDGLMDMCRSYASESGNATNPVVFELMVMSILLFQQRRIRKLEAVDCPYFVYAYNSGWSEFTKEIYRVD